MDKNTTQQIFEKACKALRLPNDVPFFATLKSPLIPLHENAKKTLIQKKTIAFYKLSVITQYKNGDWKPDYTNPDQIKYYPWFYYDSKLPSPENIIVIPFSISSNFGAPLVCRDQETAVYIGQQFPDLWKDLLLDNNL